MKEQIDEIVNRISDDLKNLAKEYGAIVIVVLLAIYAWKNIGRK